MVTNLSDHFPNVIAVKGPRFDDNNKPKPSNKQTTRDNLKKILLKVLKALSLLLTGTL